MHKLDKDYRLHWEGIFSKRKWGRYPAEDLVRFIGRNYSEEDRSNISVLELGCGPGANMWFLHREGFKVSGIDGSPTAIEAARERIKIENRDVNPADPDFRVGDFSMLPWGDETFDIVIDIYGVCCNTLDIIKKTLAETYRVMKPGGRFYTKQWGYGCTGYGEGVKIEPGTYTDIPSGPCHGVGVTHFFDREEIDKVFSAFDTVAIDVVSRTDSQRNYVTEEFLCHFMKGMK